ncbi:hypothetical protein [Mycobacteroides chelonae]|uniref:hypothetical protein n=1 Tax=Mycobacteroides chelonae TaxID=1774 RepID=UPI003AAF9629
MTPDPLEGGADRRPPTAAAAGNGSPESQRAGSPWETEMVTSYVSPHHQKKGQK